MKNIFYGSDINKYSDISLFAQSIDTQGIIENNNSNIYQFANKVKTKFTNIDFLIYTTNKYAKSINNYVYINNNLFPIIESGNESELLKKAKEVYLFIIKNIKNLIIEKNESFIELYNIDVSDYRKQINKVFIDVKAKDNIYETITYKTYMEILNESIPYGILNKSITANEIALTLLRNKQIIEKLYYIENSLDFNDYINSKLRSLLIWEHEYTDEMNLYKEMLLEEIEKERTAMNEKKFAEYTKYIDKKCAIHCNGIKTGFVKFLNFKLEEPIMLLENRRTIHEIELKEIRKIVVLE